MKKIILIVLSFLLVACINIEYDYYPRNYVKELIITANTLDRFKNPEKENSPVEYIYICSIEDEKEEKVKIKNKNIKIISNGIEYQIEVNNSEYTKYIYIYNQGVNITNDFSIYIGEIENIKGNIINLPPIHFKKNVRVDYDDWRSYLLEGFSYKSKTLFSGSPEEYKEWKKNH